MTQPIPLALTALSLVRTGRFDALRDLFVEGLRPMLSESTLTAAWQSATSSHGALTAVGAATTEAVGPVTVVTVALTFDRGMLNAVIAVAADGHLTSMQLVPATAPAVWQPPSYVDDSAFTDAEIAVGSGPSAVPGTLSRPRRPGPWPAAVLLPGSGPLDRDATIPPNKPLKDIAGGLASRGIAVLRFDKMTFAHPEHAAHLAGFTLTDEYVHHAVAAVKLIQPEASRVFLLGHSLGGTVAPRVAAAEPAVAGMIILAGGAQPLHWSIVRQFSYLASLDSAQSEALRPMIDAATRQATSVDSPGLSESTPVADLPFGVPAAYWLDLRAYDPVAAANQVDKPMLILQGGRDYQVTVADDLSRWRAGLAGRPDVTIRVYERDDHAFFAGDGRSTPAEYQTLQHVDAAVISEIADWITRTAAELGDR